VGVEIATGPGADLLEHGVAVRDHFIGEGRVRELIRCAEVRRDRGDFNFARVGAGERALRRRDVRGDRTCWFSPPLFEEESALLGDFDRLRLDLNRDAYLGLFELELHYAWYSPGMAYERHVDQLQGRDQRKVSLVLYLNEAWMPESGGELRIFDGERVRDIEPIAGRLVFFLTAGLEHAVLPTRRDRLSITGWFRQRG